MEYVCSRHIISLKFLGSPQICKPSRGRCLVSLPFPTSLLPWKPTHIHSVCGVSRNITTFPDYRVAFLSPTCATAGRCNVASARVESIHGLGVTTGLLVLETIGNIETEEETAIDYMYGDMTRPARYRSLKGKATVHR